MSLPKIRTFVVFENRVQKKKKKIESRDSGNGKVLDMGTEEEMVGWYH